MKLFSLRRAVLCAASLVLISSIPFYPVSISAATSGTTPAAQQLELNLSAATEILTHINIALQQLDIERALLLYQSLQVTSSDVSVQSVQAKAGALITKILVEQHQTKEAKNILESMDAFGSSATVTSLREETAATLAKASPRLLLAKANSTTQPQPTARTDATSTAKGGLLESLQSSATEITSAIPGVSGAINETKQLVNQGKDFALNALQAEVLQLLGSKFQFADEQLTTVKNFFSTLDLLEDQSFREKLRNQANAGLDVSSVFKSTDFGLYDKLYETIALCGSNVFIRHEQARIAKGIVVATSMMAVDLPQAQANYTKMKTLGTELEIREQRAIAANWLVAGYRFAKNSTAAEAVYADMATLGTEKSIRLERAHTAAELTEYYALDNNYAAAEKVFSTILPLGTEKEIIEYHQEAAQSLIDNYVRTGQPQKALAIFDAVAPSIAADGHAKLAIRLLIYYCKNNRIKEAQGLYARYPIDAENTYFCWSSEELIRALCLNDNVAAAQAVYDPIALKECVRSIDSCYIYKVSCINLLLEAYAAKNDIASAQRLYDTLFAKGNCRYSYCRALLTMVGLHLHNNNPELAHALYTKKPPSNTSECMQAAKLLITALIASQSLDKAQQVYDNLPTAYSIIDLESRIEIAGLLLAAYKAIKDENNTKRMERAVGDLEGDLIRARTPRSSGRSSWGDDDD